MRAIVPVEIELDFAEDVKRGRCSFCRKRVSLRDGFVELYTCGDERLCYPNGFAPIAVLSHAKCGPDAGYAIRLERLLGNVEGKLGMINHVEAKVWGSIVYLNAIRKASALAKGLTR